MHFGELITSFCKTADPLSVTLPMSHVHMPNPRTWLEWLASEPSTESCGAESCSNSSLLSCSLSDPDFELEVKHSKYSYDWQTSQEATSFPLATNATSSRRQLALIHLVADTRSL